MKRLIVFFLAVLMAASLLPSTYAATDTQINNAEALETIEEYFLAINNQNYDKIVELSPSDIRQIVSDIYSNEFNRENNMALFNIQMIELEAIVFPSEEVLSDYYDCEKLDAYDAKKVALVEAEINVSVERGLLVNGTVYFCITVVEDLNSRYILDMVTVSPDVAGPLVSGVQLAANVSTPISENILRMPTTILVYRAHAYSGESKDIIGSIEEVDFETYCKITQQGEYGAGTEEEARKAVAIAIRNFAFHRYLYRNSVSTGFHVIDSGSNGGDTNYYWDQYYNPQLTPNQNSISAVNSTRNIIILDSDNKLIPTGHYEGSANDYGQYLGRLRQRGAGYLASLGYTCEQIIHYYYDRVETVEGYYNTQVAVGPVSVHTHTIVGTPINDLRHSLCCTGCGNLQIEAHEWYISFESGLMECFDCGHVQE